MYGTQTLQCLHHATLVFENDVEMYGTQTLPCLCHATPAFENDVEMYGTQTTMVFLNNDE